VRLDAQLFGETQSRIVISTTAHNASKILGQAKVLGIPAVNIGKVGGGQLKIKPGQGEFAWDLAELHDLWFHSIARAMR
jgi:phosphoribosylformylglycinamidine synthase